MLNVLISKKGGSSQTYLRSINSDGHGGLATGLHDAGLLLPGGVHHHPEEECQLQQISGEN